MYVHFLCCCLVELPAGIPVEFLVGFRNKGKEDFILESLEASFRYPMDFNFYIQNFSAIGYNKNVQPEQEATLAYSFIPSEAFAGRPFGLNINLAYRDISGNSFQEAVYNETVQIVELEEGILVLIFFELLIETVPRFGWRNILLVCVLGGRCCTSFGHWPTNFVVVW